MSETNSSYAETFRTHANYLRAFSQLAGFGVWPAGDDDVLAKLANRVLEEFPQSLTSVSIDEDQLVGCLNRAWGTELILNLSARLDEDELVRVANSWGSVQTYYVGYAATQALILSEGKLRPTSHPKTQDQVAHLWVRRRGAVAPFSFAAGAGSETARNGDGYLNGPSDRVIDWGVHAWSNCDRTNCWDIAARALRSTRGDAIDSRLRSLRESKARLRKKEWQQEEEKRQAERKKPRKVPKFPKSAMLTPEETAECKRNTRPYTLLDYLFRLRIKANYEEARMFTDGPDNNSISYLVSLDMTRISAAILVAHEIRIGSLLGHDFVCRVAEDWVDKNSPPPGVGIARRLPLLRSVMTR